MELWKLLAHNHWLTLRVLGREVRLCARCSGYAAGLLASMALHNSIGLPQFHPINVDLQLPIILLTILPLTLDWLTQSWGWRESNNGLRLLTGAILGVGVFLFSLIEAAPSIKRSYYVYMAIAVFLFGLIGELLDKPLSSLKRV
ncbi:MAG: DUF2085 domain-containing protein [Candidatus Bathyarchaeia archaeon]